MAIIQTGELEPSSSLIITKGKIAAPTKNMKEMEPSKKGAENRKGLVDKEALSNESLKEKIGKEVQIIRRKLMFYKHLLKLDFFAA